MPASTTGICDIRIHIQNRDIPDNGYKVDRSFARWMKSHLNGGVGSCAIQLQNGERQCCRCIGELKEESAVVIRCVNVKNGTREITSRTCNWTEKYFKSGTPGVFKMETYPPVVISSTFEGFDWSAFMIVLVILISPLEVTTLISWTLVKEPLRRL